MMSTEIERKFLVEGTDWKTESTGIQIRQGYLNTDKERTVRIRITGNLAFLTVKSISTGISRREFEYPVPHADAAYMLDYLAERPLIEKIRYRIPYDGLVWEVDEFSGENAGLIIAEVELPTEKHPFQKPGWAGKEVSDDPRYFNNNLALNPFGHWP